MASSKAAIGAALVVAVGAIGLAATRAVEFVRAEPSKRSGQSLRERLLDTYDLSGATMPMDDLRGPFVAKDGIPALTDPERAPAAKATFPDAAARVVEVVIGGEAVAYPLAILNFHEIANDEVGGVPVAVTYCPLCDSVSVFDRRLGDRTLEFGVSGFLHNSNVVMYERGNMGLWSQVAMRALTGPDAGERLEHLPVRVVSFERFRRAHPGGEVLTTETGHARPYGTNPYAAYFEDPGRVFHAFEYDDRLPPKALGMGIRAGGEAWFVRGSAAMEGPVVVETGLGAVEVRGTGAGLETGELPAGVDAVQTFYHSWAAFHPGTAIVPAVSED